MSGTYILSRFKLKVRLQSYRSYTPADIVQYTPGHNLEAHSAKTIHVHNSD